LAVHVQNVTKKQCRKKRTHMSKPA
jgi:hypothetical protein